MIRGICVTYSGVPIADYGMNYYEIKLDLLSGWLTAYFQFAKYELKEIVNEIGFEKFKYLFFQCPIPYVLFILVVDPNDSRKDYSNVVEQITEKLMDYDVFLRHFDGNLGEIQLIFEEILTDIDCDCLMTITKKYRRKRRTIRYCTLFGKNVRISKNFCNMWNVWKCLEEKDRWERTAQLTLAFLPFEHDFQLEANVELEDVFNFVEGVMQQEERKKLQIMK